MKGSFLEVGTLVFLLMSYFCSARLQRFDPEKEVNISKCWAPGKFNKPAVIPAPVFRVDENNLSFEGCGQWKYSSDAGKNIPPWSITLKVMYSNAYCRGVVVSDRTIISFDYSYAVYEKMNDGEIVSLHKGACANKKDKNECFWDQALLQRKVLSVKKVETNLFAEKYSLPLFVWTVEKLELSDILRPVCLWNGDNQNDQSLIYYANNLFEENLKRVELLALEECLPDKTALGKCGLYRQAICLSGFSRLAYMVQLLVKSNERFYLRGMFANFLTQGSNIVAIDLLPKTVEIVEASSGLTVMRPVPQPKTKIDFGDGQSFVNCGQSVPQRRKREKIGAVAGFILFGEPVKKTSENPWHATLSLRLDEDFFVKHFCGATLISRRVLITAAHCLFIENKLMQPEKLEVVLGLLEFSKSNENSRQAVMASNLMVHPGYNASSEKFIDDIALILVAENQIQINNNVRPICLWNDDYQLNKITNTTGKVVGWGLTANHTQPEILQQANLKVATYEECYKSRRSFMSTHLRPGQNFCAGFPHNQTNACRGDSGGGFIILKNDRRFLRGIVSFGRIRTVTLPENKKLITCDPSAYSIYTDTTNYIQWIVDLTPDINV
ncbi:phenoloxidase-activating enzyme-like [Neocloeon triangulifer]|uniref:phenoloxidase-activating enzyme-like n=1 Tax=Neocloeon triangulifer TaxID=2078957 RepID=UPI00286FAB65|nr:phenoloxidase-activating enzyme-like [Neocloeon triangulifer]